MQGTLERVPLDEASWVDLGRGWLSDPGEVYDALAGWDGWRQGAVWRFDHLRGENRLSGFVRPGPDAPHPALTEAHRALRRHYGVELSRRSGCPGTATVVTRWAPTATATCAGARPR